MAQKHNAETTDHATIVEHTALVRSIAFQFKNKLPPHIELDDLIQNGMLGLIDALLKYQAGEATFETYASQRIRGAILDSLRADDILPRHLRKMNKEYEQANQKLSQTLQRLPKASEVANELGIHITSYQRALTESARMQFFSYDGSAHIENIEPQNTPYTADTFDTIAERQFHKNLQLAIQKLPERDQLFMALYYERDMSMKEIAAYLKLTEARISQMYKLIVAKLKSAMKDQL